MISCSKFTGLHCCCRWWCPPHLPSTSWRKIPFWEGPADTCDAHRWGRGGSTHALQASWGTLAKLTAQPQSTPCKALAMQDWRLHLSKKSVWWECCRCCFVFKTSEANFYVWIPPPSLINGISIIQTGISNSQNTVFKWMLFPTAAHTGP